MYSSYCIENGFYFIVKRTIISLDSNTIFKNFLEKTLMNISLQVKQKNTTIFPALLFYLLYNALI